MAKVITFSRYFPSYHPRAGQETLFVEKNWSSWLNHCSHNFELDFLELEKELKNYWEKIAIVPKHHTIRAGYRFNAGDWFSPRVWSDRPYNSKQIAIAPDIRIEKTWDFEITVARKKCTILLNKNQIDTDTIGRIAHNDGLSLIDFAHWFKYPGTPFDGQIICWSNKIEYP